MRIVFAFGLLAAATNVYALRDFCFFGNAPLVPGSGFPTAVKDARMTVAENSSFDELITETYVEGPPGTGSDLSFYTLVLPSVYGKQQSALQCAPVAGMYKIAGHSELCLIEWEYGGHLYCPRTSNQECPYDPAYMLSGMLPKTCP